MCDTLVAVGSATADGTTLFAKNSDREPNEAHELIAFPRTQHPAGAQVQCTYLTIPQVPETYAVLLAKPFWMWGCEMGANEHGLVIGNEALFTRVPGAGEPRLIGMDFIRLALERSQSAWEALETITTLLAQYGQGGECGLHESLTYHNSYILADAQEAFVLETAGFEWAAVRVRDVASISNAITIGREWDFASENLVAYALAKGWCKTEAEFDFARCYSAPLYTHFSAARPRQACTLNALRAKRGALTVADMMAFLRHHDGSQVDTAVLGADVCMHAGFGPVRRSQTTGSMVSQLKQGQATHWLTGTAAPCLSLFKPVWLEAGLPAQGEPPTAVYSAANRWWRHENLHRAVLRDYATRAPLVQKERDKLEAHFLAEANQLDQKSASAQERRAFSERCFRADEAHHTAVLSQVKNTAVSRRSAWYYRRAWQKFNQQAHFPAD